MKAKPIIITSLIILFLIPFNLTAQIEITGRTDTLDFGVYPRMKENYEKSGHYEIITSSDKTEIDPGENLKIKVFMTGYGQIGGSKLIITPSKAIFDIGSKIYVSADKKRSDERRLVWGADSLDFFNKGDGYTLNLIGGREFKIADTSFQTMYIDVDHNPKTLQILTEISIEHAPIEMQLKILDYAPSGDYKINFYYTYYNGNEWQGSVASVDFKVSNWTERHTTFLTVVGLIFGVLGIIPVVELVANYYIKWFKKPKVTQAKKVQTTEQTQKFTNTKNQSRR